MSDKKDFFISYKSVDKEHALWIDKILRQEGFSTIIQANDFEAGNFLVNNIDKALINSKRLIVVLTKAYVEDKMYCNMEWQTALRNYRYDDRAIIPVKMDDVKPTGLLGGISYISIYNKKGSEREKTLIDGIKGKGIENEPIISQEKPCQSIYLPHSRNPYFTGRAEILNLIRENFQNGNTLSRVQAIRGLGGVGKTSIALEYAYAHRKEYKIVWWVNAENSDTVLSSYRKFCSEQGLISENDKDDVVLRQMEYWFLNNENWFFVYDNADAADYASWLEEHLPKERNGHVLITTRSYNFIKSKIIDLKIFNETESVSFFKTRTDKSGEEYSDDSAKELAKLLQYLPLALEQAAAYITETPGVAYNDYIDLYKQYGIKIFNEQNNLVDYTSTIAITWKISMSKITNESTLQMFNMCAYLAPDAIPVNMFVRGNKNLPESLQTEIINDIQRNGIIADLVRYSLLSSEGMAKDEKRQLYMHRLLQEVVQKDFGTDYRWLVHCLDLMHDIIEWKEHIKESVDSFKQEASHAISVAEKSSAVFSENYEKINNVAKIFLVVSRFYAKLSYLSLSLSCINKGIEIIEQICLKEHSAYNNLIPAYSHRGIVYNLMADYDKAIEEHSKSIDIGKNLLAKNELIFEDALAITYMNRGISYENLKKHDNALQDKNIAIDMLERLHKEGKLNNENDLALVYMNRAATYEAMEKYKESLADYTKSIEIWEQMKREGKIINESDLAMVYANKGITNSKVFVEKNGDSLSKAGKATYNKMAAMAQLNYRKKQLNGGKK